MKSSFEITQSEIQRTTRKRSEMRIKKVRKIGQELIVSYKFPFFKTVTGSVHEAQHRATRSRV